MEFAKTRNIVDSEEQVVGRLCELIEQSAKEAINERNQFVIAVSGGSVVNMLVKGLPNIKTCWPKWRIVFCDERLVPNNDKESTYGLYKTNLIPVTPLTEEQFIAIDFSLVEKPSENANAAAADYEKRLKNLFSKSSLFTTPDGDVYPILDCAILGMGPDGHTCSLFPGDTKSLEAKSWVIPIVNSPKPPPCRVTLTLPVLNYARTVIFPISGSSKASTVKQVLTDSNKSLPAYLVKSLIGEVFWILDSLAASELS